jgi:hypothetical protein
VCRGARSEAEKSREKLNEAVNKESGGNKSLFLLLLLSYWTIDFYLFPHFERDRHGNKSGPKLDGARGNFLPLHLPYYFLNAARCNIYLTCL